MEPMKIIISIFDRGQGVVLQKLFRDYQVCFHIQCSGCGTATSEIRDILGLDSSEKDVVLSCATQSSACALLHAIQNDVRGIACSLPLSALNSLVANLVNYQGS